MSSTEQRLDALEDAIEHLTSCINNLTEITKVMIKGIKLMAETQQEFCKMFTPNKDPLQKKGEDNKEIA
jgi:hypothetical protein